jgi:toxin FitB
MIILDTNVVSALMRLHMEPEVERWLNAQQTKRLYATALTIFEIRQGIDAMPAGKRRTANEGAFSLVMTSVLGSQIFDLDVTASNAAGVIFAKRHRRGEQPGAIDCLIAGIAVMQGAKIATRNIKDFANLDIEIINPWLEH